MNHKKKDKIQQELALANRNELFKVSKATSLDTIKAVEDEVLAESIAIVKGVLDFANIGFEQDGEPIIPQDWESLPQAELDKKVRLAKAGWMSSSEIPHGAKMAHATMLGIIKARATQDSGHKTLNIENATFPSPSPLNKELDVIDVDE